MKIETRDLGSIEIDERQKVHFPHGLYGFEHLTRWALLDSPQPPFYLLQSAEEKDMSFIVINPYLFRPDYLLDIADADYTTIYAPPKEQLLVFAIVTVQGSPTNDITANLMGPLLINHAKRIGVQSIQQDSRWNTKHTILERASAPTEDPRVVDTRHTG